MNIKSKVSLSPYNTYKVGGEAEYFVKVDSVADLLLANNWALNNNKHTNIIGRGSNLLIASGTIAGLTIVNNIKGYNIDNNGVLVVYSGTNLSWLATKLSKQGWSGLEWAVGIPGSVGGAVAMNAGAHKESISNCLIDITALSKKSNLVRFPKSELDFSYRYSNIQHSNYYVVECRLQLQKEKNYGEAYQLSQEYLNYRHNTQPYNLPSCGSVFRNPLNKQAGRLIEESYLKGFEFLGAQVSRKHGNFIINKGDATSESIYSVMCFVKEVIQKRYNIELQSEVKLLGKFNK